jgi:hypothetical protein
LKEGEVTNQEKRDAVLASAAKVVEEKNQGVKQAYLIMALAKEINKFFDKHPDVKLEMTCLVLDTLTEQMCVAVFDDAEADSRVERVGRVTIQ